MLYLNADVDALLVARVTMCFLIRNRFDISIPREPGSAKIEESVGRDHILRS